MKKITYIILALAFFATGCNIHTGPHTVISTDANGKKTTLEYYGKVAFTDDSSAIKSMAPGSYIRFEKDGKELSAERRNDAITYKLNNGSKTASLNEDNKHLIADVLRSVGHMDKK